MLVKQSIEQNKSPIQPITFNWADNPDVKHLLDVISSVLAEEYIEIAKENKDVFIKGGADVR